MAFIDTFGGINICTLLSLPIHEHNISVHLASVLWLSIKYCSTISIKDFYIFLIYAEIPYSFCCSWDRILKNDISSFVIVHIYRNTLHFSKLIFQANLLNFEKIILIICLKHLLDFPMKWKISLEGAISQINLSNSITFFLGSVLSV